MMRPIYFSRNGHRVFGAVAAPENMHSHRLLFQFPGIGKLERTRSSNAHLHESGHYCMNAFGTFRVMIDRKFIKFPQRSGMNRRLTLFPSKIRARTQKTIKYKNQTCLYI